jgi:hypothetical protein
VLSHILKENNIAAMRVFLYTDIVDVDMRVPMDSHKVPLLFGTWEHRYTDMYTGCKEC